MCFHFNTGVTRVDVRESLSSLLEKELDEKDVNGLHSSNSHLGIRVSTICTSELND